MEEGKNNEKERWNLEYKSSNIPLMGKRVLHLIWMLISYVAVVGRCLNCYVIACILAI